MTISALKNGFELSDKMNTIQIFPTQKEIFDKAPFIITRLNDNLDTSIYKISQSGEFEIADILVHSYKVLDALDQTADLFRITIEGVDVLYVTANIHTIPTHLIEEIGNISVIIFELDSKILAEKKMEIAQEFDVYYSVINGNNSGADLFDKVITDENIIKKLKVKQEDFDSMDENVNLQFICIK